MEHHLPHKNSAFEGYYSKFNLPSGAHLALVICSIKEAKFRPHMVSFTYVTQDVHQTYQKEIWADEISMAPSVDGQGFSLDIPGIGFVRWNDESSAEYELVHPEFTFKARSTSTVPWSSARSTPEGLLVHLPLPLHWHVQSLASACAFELKIASHGLDISGTAEVHTEKNWAQSFPSAHMWLQAREGDRGFCCAGGQILGMEAFLLGYRSKDLNLDFRPPFAVRFAGMSPFMSYTTSWDDRTFQLQVRNLWQKLTVEATAPRGTFFSLSSPFPEGHRENFLGQSFQATIRIKIYECGLLSSWLLIREDEFTSASLEFGGEYYPIRGTKERFN